MVYKFFRNYFPLTIAILSSLTLVLFGIMSLIPVLPFTVRNKFLTFVFFALSIFGIGFITGFYIGQTLIFMLEIIIGPYEEVYSLTIP